MISFSAAGQGEINIHLKSGRIIPTRYVYLYSGYHSYVKIHEKKGEKIPITLVDHVEGPDETGHYRYIIPVNDIWAERGFTSDRITIFHTDIVSGKMAAGYKPKSCLYSKDGGPLKSVKLRNLKEDIAECAASMEYIKKGKRIGGTQTLVRVVSYSLIIAGIIDTADNFSVANPDDPESDSGSGISPMVIIGAAGAWVPFFMENAKRQKYIEALKVYQ
ncbi:MAG TPA: hypothetical protein VGK59_11245 [Ohtaekwangia sp.]